MATTLDMFSDASVGQTMASMAQTAARPNFELRFSQMQNTVINRVNKKIEEINSAGVKVDATKVLERARLQRASDLLASYEQQVSNQYAGVADVYNRLLDLNPTGADTDPSDFNRRLAQINETASMLPNVDGSAAGVFTIDGVDTLRDVGVLQVTRNGEQVRVNSYADFTDGAEADAAIMGAMSRASASVNILSTTIDSISGLRDSVDRRLGAVSLEIEAAKTEASAERAKQIKDLEQEYGRMLNAFSLSFESSQSVTDRIKGLLQPTEYQKGSVMNLFT